MTKTARIVENINREVYDALEIFGIDTCTLLVQSISGVYALNFLYAYHEKVNAFIAIDNTVYAGEFETAIASDS